MPDAGTATSTFPVFACAGIALGRDREHSRPKVDAHEIAASKKISVVRLDGSWRAWPTCPTSSTPRGCFSSTAGPSHLGAARCKPVPPALSRLTRGRLAGTLAMWLATALFALPMLMLFVAPLRAPGLPPPPHLQVWPDAPSLQSFRDAFTLVPLGRALWNSTVLCLMAVPLTLLTASWAALALTLLTGRLRWLLAGLLLVLAMVPVTAVWIPRFVLFNSLGLVGSSLPLLAPALMGGSPLFVLLYLVAMRRIPPELLDAARMEGAGLLATWWRVVMPLVKPTTTAIGLLTVVLFWGNFIDALLYLRTEKQLTAPPMLHALHLLGPTSWSVFLAGALVVSLPVVLAFLLAQRFLWSLERGAGWMGR
jgi:multiple sugar transport system permease protein